MNKKLHIILGVLIFCSSAVNAQETKTLQSEGISPAEIPAALNVCATYVDLIKKKEYIEAADRYNFYGPTIDAASKEKMQEESVVNIKKFLKIHGPVKSFEYVGYSLQNMLKLPDGGLQPLVILVKYKGMLKNTESTVEMRVIKMQNTFKVLSFEMKIPKK